MDALTQAKKDDLLPAELLQYLFADALAELIEKEENREEDNNNSADNNAQESALLFDMKFARASS